MREELASVSLRGRACAHHSPTGDRVSLGRAAENATVLVLKIGDRSGVSACRSLRRAGYHVVGADTTGAGRAAARHCHEFRPLPELESSVPRFLEAVETVCSEVGAAAVLPNDHEGTTQLLAARAMIGGAVVVGPTEAEYAALCDKAGLDRTAAAIGLDRPATWIVDGPDIPAAPTLPCIVKPATTDTRVAASVVRRDARLVTTREAFADAAQDMVSATGSAVVEERVVGRQWRVHFFSTPDGFAGVPVYTARTYPRSAGMSTVQIVRRDSPGELTGLAERLVRAVGYTGPGSVQFIERAGRFFVHDVNLRLPATVALTIAAGLDLPRLSVEGALGRGPDLGRLHIRYGATYLWLSGELRAVLGESGVERAQGLAVLARDAARAFVRRSHVVDLPSGLTAPRLPILDHGRVRPG